MSTKLPLGQVEDEAAAWLLKREDPSWSAADEAGLASWLEADTGHRVAFSRLGGAWRQVDRLRVLRRDLPQDEIPARGEIETLPVIAGMKSGQVGSPALPLATPRHNHESALHRPVLRAVLAASLVLAIVLGWLRFDANSGGASYRTAIGGLSSVPVGDGSKITLNTDTEVRVKVSDRERRIELVKGEAFFEVARDARRPFIVHAQGQRVVAVGTQFSVRMQPDQLQVVVTEGRVRVEGKPSLLGDPQPIASLVAGNVARAHGKSIVVQETSLEKARQSLGWRSGHLVLDDTSLADAVAEFNRYNLRKLVISDPVISNITIGGNFQASNIDGFVRLLHDGFDVEATEADGQIRLRRMPAGSPDAPSL